MGWVFAATLERPGLHGWERVTGLFAFDLGIEAMQLSVIALILPSMFLLSRTAVYPWFRIGRVAWLPPVGSNG